MTMEADTPRDCPSQEEVESFDAASKERAGKMLNEARAMAN